ncbi:MAG: hypothetical protein IPG22_05875 [Acidobacteria bacterium]|nr:hypothetical protein [Acidobacteriota bacterium]
MDYRHSFKPICRLFGGRHVEFNEANPKPINIWNYPGIEEGNRPTKRQPMVLTDILILSKQQRQMRSQVLLLPPLSMRSIRCRWLETETAGPKFQPTLDIFWMFLRPIIGACTAGLVGERASLLET